MPTATLPQRRPPPAHATPATGDDEDMPGPTRQKRTRPLIVGQWTPDQKVENPLPWWKWLGAFSNKIGGKAFLDDDARTFARARWEAGERPGTAGADYRTIHGIRRTNEPALRLQHEKRRQAAWDDWVATWIASGGPDPEPENPPATGPDAKRLRVLSAYIRPLFATNADPAAAAAKWMAKTSDAQMSASTLGCRTFDELSAAMSLALVRTGTVKRLFAHGGEFWAVLGYHPGSRDGEGEGGSESCELYRVVPLERWGIERPGEPAPETYAQRRARADGHADHVQRPGGLIVADPDGRRWVIDGGRRVVVGRGGGE